MVSILALNHTEDNKQFVLSQIKKNFFRDKFKIQTTTEYIFIEFNDIEKEVLKQLVLNLEVDNLTVGFGVNDDKETAKMLAFKGLYEGK